MTCNIFPIMKYLLFLILLVFLFIFFHNYFIFLLLILFICLPVFSIAAGYHACKSLKISPLVPAVQGEKNTLYSIELHMRKPVPYPVFNLHIRYRMTNLYYPYETEKSFRIPYIQKKEMAKTLPFSMDRAGCLRFQVKQISTSDFLRFVSFHKKSQAECEMLILPSRFTMEEAAESVGGAGQEAWDDNPVKGSAFSDLMDLRDYRPGDRMQAIHWKLSAKNQANAGDLDGYEALIVKEYQQTAAKECNLLAELNQSSKRTMDEVLDLLFSFGSLLLEQDKAFTLCWWSKKEAMIKKEAAGSPISFITALNQMFYEEIEEETGTAYEQYSKTAEGAGSLYYLCSAEGKNPPGAEELYHYGGAKLYQITK